MVWLLSLTFFMTSLILYLLGGQWRNWIKRYLLPVSQSLMILGLTFLVNTNHWVSLALLGYIGVWLIGETTIEKWGIKSNKLDYAIYGLIASIPILAGFGILHTHLWFLGLIPLVSGLFVLDFGVWASWGKTQLLSCDVIRMSAIAGSWLIMVLVK